MRRLWSRSGLGTGSPRDAAEKSGRDAYVTDENNHILDCRFGEIRDPDGLAQKLSEMPGVVEHGLFIGMASVVLFARGSEIVELKRQD